MDIALCLVQQICFVRLVQYALSWNTKELKMSDPSLAPEFVRKMFGCQHNEKVGYHKVYCYVLTFGQPSIQNALSAVSENGSSSDWSNARRWRWPVGLASFIEPCYLIYDVSTLPTERALLDLRSTIHLGPKEAETEQSITLKCSKNRDRRIQLYNECSENLVITVCLHAEFSFN